MQRYHLRNYHKGRIDTLHTTSQMLERWTYDVIEIIGPDFMLKIAALSSMCSAMRSHDGRKEVTSLSSGILDTSYDFVATSPDIVQSCRVYDTVIAQS